MDIIFFLNIELCGILLYHVKHMYDKYNLTFNKKYGLRE